MPSSGQDAEMVGFIKHKWSDCLVVLLYANGHVYRSSDMNIDGVKTNLNLGTNLTSWAARRRRNEDRLDCDIRETVCACTYCTTLSLVYGTRKQVCARPFDIYDCPLLMDDSSKYFEWTMQQMKLREMHVFLDEKLREWYLPADDDEWTDWRLSINTCTR